MSAQLRAGPRSHIDALPFGAMPFGAIAYAGGKARMCSSLSDIRGTEVMQIAQRGAGTDSLHSRSTAVEFAILSI